MLKQCPCGKTPESLIIQACDGNRNPKWAMVGGDCCDEWLVEYRNQYVDIDSDEAMLKAVAAWNDAPRSE